MFRCALSMGIIMECNLSHIGRVVFCAGAVLENLSGGSSSLVHRDHTPCCYMYRLQYIDVVIGVAHIRIEGTNVQTFFVFRTIYM